MATPEEQSAWIRDRVGYQGDDCILWPFSKDRRVGRGRVLYEGEPQWAHRVMCRLAHGEPPTPEHQAAHICGNGHLACINPNHLEWKTNSQNQIDRVLHGRHEGNPFGWQGRLSVDQIEEMRSLKGRMTQVKIAERFGVSLGCVQYWHKVREQRGHKTMKGERFGRDPRNEVPQ